MQQAGGAFLFGLSTQDTEYQVEVATRLHLPFPLLSDADLKFAQAIGLSTFEAGGMTLLERTTLILKDGAIIHVMSPVSEPAKNAEEVLEYFKQQALDRS